MANKYEEFADNTYRKFDHTLTIHIVNSPKQLNWKGKPRNVLWDIIANKYFRSSITRRTIGHVTVEINTTDESGSEKVHRFGGQSSEGIQEYQKKLIKEGLGFSIILMAEHHQQYEVLRDYPRVTIPGIFEEKQELIDEYSELIYKDGIFSTITFVLDQKRCQKLVDYFDEYKKLTQETKGTQNPKAGNHYGFGADPLNFEGAGCANFTGAFLTKAGLNEQYQNMHEEIFAPIELFGSPKINKKSNILKVFTDTTNLSKRDSKDLAIRFPSPDILYNNVHQHFEKDEYEGMKILERGTILDSNSKYLVVQTK